MQDYWQNQGGSREDIISKEMLMMWVDASPDKIIKLTKLAIEDLKEIPADRLAWAIQQTRRVTETQTPPSCGKILKFWRDGGRRHQPKEATEEVVNSHPTTKAEVTDFICRHPTFRPLFEGQKLDEPPDAQWAKTYRGLLDDMLNAMPGNNMFLKNDPNY